MRHDDSTTTPWPPPARCAGAGEEALEREELADAAAADGLPAPLIARREPLRGSGRRFYEF